MSSLNGISIIDATTRLPGPFATMLLADMGAQVTKFESPHTAGDPFNDPKNYQHIPCFKDWYDAFNAKKSIIKTDLKDFDTLAAYKNSDILIIPSHPRFIPLSEYLAPQVLIKIAADKEFKSMHDLNAIGMTKTFKLHLNHSDSPPYLPLAGINFAQGIAMEALAGMVYYFKNQKTYHKTLYLSEVTTNVFDTFNSSSFADRPTQLHNGAFPSYGIYKSKDGFLIYLAAVEEKYWNQFLKTFEIELTSENRFSHNPKHKEEVQNKLALFDADVIRQKIQNTDICLTLADEKG